MVTNVNTSLLLPPPPRMRLGCSAAPARKMAGVARSLDQYYEKITAIQQSVNKR